MPLDPKDVVKKNKALVVCYVLALVPVILWVLLVVNGVKGGSDPGSYDRVAAKLRTMVGNLNAMAAKVDKMQKNEPTDAPLYTPQHKTAFEERNAALDKQYDAMAQIIKNRDSSLERWFPEFGDKEPPVGDMSARIKTEEEKLKKEYGDLVLSPDRTTDYLWKETIAQGTQRRVQKKFWIQDRILQAIKKGGAERLLAAVEFPPPVLQGPVGPPGGEARKPLTEAIPARFIVSATLREVPRIARELLAQDIVFKIMKIKTEALEFTIVKKEADGYSPPLIINSERDKLYGETIYNGFLMDKSKVPANEEDVLYEPRLKVTFELEAVDFDVDAILPKAPAQ